MKKHQILLAYFICLLFISCKRDKVVSVDYKLFQNESYKRNNPKLKIKFLDSIYYFSNRMPNDTSYRHFLFDLSSEYYYLNEYSKSFEVSKKTLLLSGTAKDTFSIARAYSYIGDTYQISQKDSAYYYYQKAEKIYRAINNEERIGIELFKKAYILFFEGNYLESESQVSNALLYLKNGNDAEMLFAAYSLLGLNFEKLEEYQEALKYQFLARNVLNDIEGSNSDLEKKYLYYIESSINISNVYEKMLQYNKSVQELESILNSKLKEKWTKGYVTVLANLSHSKMMSGKLNGVERNFKDALYISRKNDFRDKIVYQLKNLGEYYSTVNDTTQAINYLKQSLQLSEKLKMSEEVKSSLKLLSMIDSKKASVYDKKYIAINDSLAKAQRINRNKYARIEYETSVVEDENKLLSAKNTYILIGSFILVLLLISIIAYRYIKSQKREIEFRISQQKAEEEIFELLKEYQIKLVEAKELEQNRISKELHDSVMNNLYGARMQLGMLNDSNDKKIKEKRLIYVDLLQDIEQEIRTISHDLHIESVEAQFNYISLFTNLIEMQNEIGKTFFSIEVDDRIDWNTIDSLVKITIFRIVQESVLNVTKHAKARKCLITISFDREKDILILNICDNGKGFDQNDNSNGIGLNNIKERVKTIKAELEINSEVNIGTTISIEIKIAR